ncbi:MAG: sulfatase [Pirellulales bacterium]|nr:sulfatase [Pirellulales bacterium]
MTRNLTHRFTRGVECISVLLITLFANTATAADAPYNLIIIQTDEHHFGTLGPYGGDIVGTTHIDWLAKNGVTCTSFYATTPVCSPSRAALVSGMYPQKTPVTNNNVPLADSVVTFAHSLQKAGFQTGFAGKWHLDGDGKPQWSPKRQFGFADNRYMFNRGHWKNLEILPEGPRVGARNAKGQPNYNVNNADAESFTTDFLCNRAISFIEANHSKPFCYYISLPDPHGPNTVRKPYDTMYADVKVPIPSTFKRTAEQTPQWGKPAGVTAEQIRRLMPAYYGMVKCIDDNVGRIIAKLDDLEILDHTIIVFTSDHGDLCGEHGRLNKGVPYEGSARIPFIIYAPELLPKGHRVSEALSCIDFLPTVLSLMGISHPHPVDGRDASNLLAGNVDKWNDIAFLRSTPGNPWLCAVTSQYKLVISASDTPWLIDVENDPAEVVNLYDDQQYRSVIRRLQSQLAAYCRMHNDDHARVPEIRAQLID